MAPDRLTVARSRFYRNPLVQRAIAPLEARIGGLARVSDRRAERRTRPTQLQGIEAFAEQWATGSTSSEEPIFALGSGWRCGSTLLQRLIVSSGKVMVWGEPYELTSLVQRLAESFQPFGLRDWPRPDQILDADDGEEAVAAQLANLADNWIATTYPAPRHLLAAHRAFLSELLARSAADLGFPRWGLKEVRYGGSEIRYLRLLFPSARMVLLVRDPLDAWSSYRRFRLAFYDRWPHSPVMTPAHFSRVWNRIAGDFVSVAASDRRSLLLRYESLVSEPQTLEDLEDFLSLSVSPSVLEHRETAPQDKILRASALELDIVRRRTAPLRARLGYESR